MSGLSDRWRRWALPLSLSINVFLVTVILVHEWHRHRGPPDPRHMIEDIALELPEADAAILRRTFAAEPELQRDPFQKGKDPMNAVRAALRAEPFDPAALKTAIVDLRHGHDGFDQAMERALLAAAIAMSPEGRRRLADHRGPPGPPGGGPGGPPPGPPPER